MKKIFALALAAIMTAGMTTVAFAEVPNKYLTLTEEGKTTTAVYYDKDGEDGIAQTESMISNSGTKVSGGKTLYIPIFDGTGYMWEDMVTNSDVVDDWKVTADWEIGKPASKPEITSVKIGGTRYYAIAVELPESENGGEDLVGTIKMYTTRSGDVEDREDGSATKNYRTVDLAVEYGFKEEDFDEVVDFADAQIVNFDDVDSTEMMDFGEYLSFEVDLTGQGELNLKNNQDFDPEFAAMYDYANIDFINFVEEPSFNKIGTAYIYADEDAFIYEVTADGAKKLDATWDEDYEAWVFKTRKLTSYVVSDVELTDKTVTEDNSSSTTDGGKDNPDTGR